MKKDIKIIVAGTRIFSNFPLLKSEMNKILEKYRYFDYDFINTEIISGGAKGADELGEKFAEENSLPLRIFRADWEKYGKSAGPIRNKEMVNYVASFDCIGVLLAFWDGKSRGTKNIINQAKAAGLMVKIVRYDLLEN